MKQLLFLIICLPFVAGAQNNANKGIKFERNVSWDQVLNKAKQARRYIFVDCYASWCGPCKKMDSGVYQVDSIGRFMTEKFICLKVQMDTSKQDNEEVINAYQMAYDLKKKYKVSAFPTFLYFSPEGEIVHRGLGYKSPKEFLLLSRNALDSNSQFYSLLLKYMRGDRIYEQMRYLATDAVKFNDIKLADTIAKTYIDNYLIGLDDSAFYKKENLEFMLSFVQLVDSKGKIFSRFYSNGAKVDSILERKGLSQSVIDYIISREMITPNLATVEEHQEPNWNEIQASIKKHWGASYADRNVINAKVRWYQSKKNWKNYTKYLVRKVEIYGVGNSMQDALLNDNAYYVFMYSNNKKELTKVLSWIDESLRMNSIQEANKMDTKSNILYKLGKREQAIELEEKAARIDPKSREIQDNLEKMKKGEPTWPHE